MAVSLCGAYLEASNEKRKTSESSCFFKFPSFSRERERVNRSSSLLSRALVSFLSLVLLFLLSVPSSFAQMLASPVYFSRRVYPLTLASQDSPLAGLKGRSYEYISQAIAGVIMIFTDPSWSWTNKKEAENRRSEIFKWASHLKNEWDREKFKKNIRDCYSSFVKHIDRDLSQDVLDLKNKLCP